MQESQFPRLHPVQVCFVVEDVDATVDECVAAFGWGPFHRFSAPVAEARYRDWVGSKNTDVALGMAGAVQVELIHVHDGHDTVEAYQARYGAGFQHLGISCRDREQAIEALEEIGAVVDDRVEHEGIRIAFIDTPTGPGMFELLHSTGESPPPGGGADATQAASSAPKVTLDRATIVTRDLDRALEFYSRAFRWEGVRSESCTLRFDGTESRVRRARGQAGQLLLELVEPNPDGDDLYARHLVRGDHGLVHAGGISTLSTVGELDAEVKGQGEWLDEAEAFTLYRWPDDACGLQVRGALQ